MFAACGPQAVSDLGNLNSRCLSMTEPGSNGVVTSSPSKVSWSFRVDTCGGEPVAGLSATQFEIYEDDKKVSTYESQQHVASRGERFKLFSVVLLDLSGSMLRSGEFPALQGAAGEYLKTALKNGGDAQRVQLMTFDGRDEPQVLVPFTSDLSALQAGLASLSESECTVSAQCAGFADRKTCAGWRCVDDSTNLNGAIVKTLAAVDAARSSTDVPWHDGALVVFTDGTDQASRVSTAAAQSAVNNSTEHVFAVGLGGEVDIEALKSFGRDGYWPVAKAEQLESAFTEIADRVSGLANRFYVLEYCSPKRSGTHTIEIRATATTEREGTLTGSLSSSFDATGFESGCQL